MDNRELLFGKLSNEEANDIGEYWLNWASSKTTEAKKENAGLLFTLLQVIAKEHNTNIVTVWNWCFY